MRKFQYFKANFLLKSIKRKIDRIYIHTVAVRGESSLASHDKYHRDVKKWDGFGYHEYIRKDGTCLPGRDPDVPGAGVLGDNAHTYHIVLEGHGDYEEWTDKQWEALIVSCHSVMRRATTKNGQKLVDVFKANPMRLLGHREVNTLVKLYGWARKFKTLKSCPGNMVDMSEVRRKVWGALK